MAKFVLAGKGDCPYYAKAELLADLLRGSLPNFSIHKISINPDEWTEWLEDTCIRNEWKHEQSPLIWRELVDQGGKGMLLGGFSDFLEHCQEYYGITYNMPSDMMLSVAAENLETKMNLNAEKQHRVSLTTPFHIWISSAVSPVCQFLIPDLLSAEVFPHISTISLHLLDLEGDQEELQGMKMETEDLALPLLHQVTIHTNLEAAFHKADVILLLDERLPEGDGENEVEKEKKRQIKSITARYQEYGQLIDARANKEVKVIVAGDSFVNLRCSLLLENAPSVDSHRVVGMATQLENEARALIANKLRVRASDVTDVIVWGNISGSFHADLQKAKVFHYNGAIQGPDFFFQAVLQMLHDKKWLEKDFQHLLKCQRADVTSKTRRAAAMSAANGILAVLKAWNGDRSRDEVLSVGVQSTGHPDLPDGLVFSVPATFMDGKWSVMSGVAVGEELRERLQLSAGELRQEKDLGSENYTSHEDENFPVQ
ncbi:hypothetical protein LDENG_00183610 [Lucifuga dentata]|nr:hypothetical protein LDENG_00183610 [Lucifuga dentata]